MNRIFSRLDWIYHLNRYIVAPRQDSAITLNAITQYVSRFILNFMVFYIQIQLNLVQIPIYGPGHDSNSETDFIQLFLSEVQKSELT